MSNSKLEEVRLFECVDRVRPMRILRTPDKYFVDLPDWPYDPHYFTSTLFGLEVRIAYYDEGDPSAQETVVLTHGMSAWS